MFCLCVCRRQHRGALAALKGSHKPCDEPRMFKTQIILISKYYFSNFMFSFFTFAVSYFQRRDFKWSSIIEKVNNETFRHERYLPLQREVINANLLGKDCFVLMPTGKLHHIGK